MNLNLISKILLHVQPNLLSDMLLFLTFVIEHTCICGFFLGFQGNKAEEL